MATRLLATLAILLSVAAVSTAVDFDGYASEVDAILDLPEHIDNVLALMDIGAPDAEEQKLDKMEEQVKETVKEDTKKNGCDAECPED